MTRTDADQADETEQDAGWFDETTATFGDRLAAARDEAGLTQKDLAQRLGVKLSTLRAWEDDLSEPRANRLQMLAGMLGVSLSWLLTGRGDGPQAPGDAPVLPADLTALLTEIRMLRSQMVQAGEKMAQIEKRLRASFRELL